MFNPYAFLKVKANKGDKMKKCTLFLIITVMAVFVFGCNNVTDSSIFPDNRGEVVDQRINIVNDSREISSLIDTANHPDLSENFENFSMNLYAHVQEKFPNYNIMVSPLSLAVAISILANGADGETLNEMYHALGFTGLSPIEVNSYMYYLQNFLTANPSLTLNIANSLWQNQLVSLKRTFVDLSFRYFDAGLYPITTAQAINDWVSRQTNGKIEEIIDEVSEDMILFIINAVYFNADWREQFDKNLTQRRVFHAPVGDVEVDFMEKNNKRIAYKRGAFYEAIRLPYKDGRTYFYAFLPNEGVSVEEFVSMVRAGENGGHYVFEANTDRFEFDTVFNENSAPIFANFMEFDNVTIRLPKFKHKFEDGRMNDVLAAMGMPTVFSSNADLSNLVEGSGRFYVERVIHKTYIDVNEEGTEAAAVTGIDVRVVSARLELYLNVNFNRPFFYVIRDEEAGVNLFMGQVVRPEYE